MSQQDLLNNLVGRAKMDRDFADQLYRDPEAVLRSEGLPSTTVAELQANLMGSMSPIDWSQVFRDHASDPSASDGGKRQREAFTAVDTSRDGNEDGGSEAARFTSNRPQVQAWQPPQTSAPTDPGLLKLQQEEMTKIARAQSDRMIDLGQFTVQTLKDTIQHATGTYKKINVMNQVMFWMGIALFLFSVGYAVYSHNLTYSIAFAGLGTLSFIGTFILGPLGATQGALSDLISAEIAFMSYFEQIFLIEGFARIPCRENSPMLDPERMERASELMQLRSMQTADLLHRYLEKANKDSTAGTNKVPPLPNEKPASNAADATKAILNRH